jgi:hypothetical protein
MGLAWSCIANSATRVARDCWNTAYVTDPRLPGLSSIYLYVSGGGCFRLVGASWLIRQRRKQASAGDFIYIFYGTLDHPEDLPPKGEFFCKKRDSWMPEIPGMTLSFIF